MLTNKERLSLKTLSRLYKHGLDILDPINILPADITGITPLNGQFVVTLDPNTEIEKVYPGLLVHITECESSGFRFVESVDHSSHTITISEVYQQNGQRGRTAFYSIDATLLDSYVNIAIRQAETLTMIPMFRVEEFTEYRSSTGTNQIILQRKKYRSIESIKAVIPTYTPGYYPAVSVADIDQGYALNRGILKIKSTSYVGTNLVMRTFPKNTDIQISGTIGYDDIDMPQDLLLAIEYMASAAILIDEHSRNGVPNTFSMDGFSQSMDVGKDIKAYKSLAIGLMSGYISSTAGS
ncbi:hypothetical protein EHR03_13120 [Leptospira mayottensis]|uniref:Uncharacterized protein n=1 Tax=Leptospira mayottensis 200901116 TaxID=1192864 RepID=M6VM73_9LEPT|nr:hypothetical protein [Leptospira mayottensis]AVH81566.1 hypothetical protein [Leptospira mayottensis 200901116]TGN00362.1 hypothetical protein EHR03_13120 [Leptospira mayottensis]